MKCLVCDQVNSTMLCTQCGFDASRDYGRYPTFGPVGRVPSVSAKKNQWQSSQKKSVSSPNGPQFVDYLKMVTQAAEEDSKERASQEHKLMLELQSANDQISTLKREQKILTDSLIPENKSLKKRISTLFDQNKALIKESNQMEDKVRDLATKLVEAERLYQEALKRISSLEEKNHALETQLKQKQTYLDNANEGLKIRANEIAELRADLEAERSKGLISRLFNR